MQCPRTALSCLTALPSPATTTTTTTGRPKREQGGQRVTRTHRGEETTLLTPRSHFPANRIGFSVSRTRLAVSTASTDVVTQIWFLFGTTRPILVRLPPQAWMLITTTKRGGRDNIMYGTSEVLGVEGGAKIGGGGRGGLVPTTCRPRVWRVLVVVVVLLMTAQFSVNLLFYRNYDSLFYVNVTSATASDLPLLAPLKNNLRWIGSRMSWMHPVPVTPPPSSSRGSSSAPTPPQDTKSRAPGHNTASAGGGAIINPPSDTNKSNNETTIDSEVKVKDHHEKVDNKTSSQKTKESESKHDDKTNARTSKPLHEVTRSVDSDGTSTSGGGGGTSELSSTEKPNCPPVPPNLIGRMKIQRTAPTLEEQELAHTELDPGGHFRPPDCRARHKVAVIIPYRDRVHHLAIFLNHVHPMLQRQQVDYAIFVVEQAGSGKFNRAMLMNVGALEALRQYRFSCFIFHDVDLLPEDDRNLYNCPEQPRHMSIAIDVMKYKLPYNDIFGGVSAMTVDQFRAVNGFSNKFWGWGGEDDDMSNRIKFHGFFISRYPANIGRYTMLSHKKDEPNPRRYQYLHEGKKRFKSDGLTSVKYRTLDIQLRRLYTWVYVDLLPS